MVVKIVFVMCFLCIVLVGKRVVGLKQITDGVQALKNVMGEIGSMELVGFPSGIYLLHIAGKNRWVKLFLPDFGISPQEELNFKTAMKAYGLSCSVLAGLIGGILIALSETKGVEPYLIYGGAIIGSYFIPGSKLKKNMILRERLIKREFPKIIDQTIILLEAGYSMAMIWRHFSRELEENNSVSKELKKLADSFAAGKGEEELYKEMIKILNSKIVVKFCNLCIQSLKKGSVDLVTGLQEISTESWQERKWDAVKLGEEASGKMIIPLMFVFVGVLIIVMVPAILQLGMI